MFARRPAHAESSSTTPPSWHWDALLQAGSRRVPWHVAALLQTAGSPNVAAEQSLAAAQQSPVAQQKPFWQCPLVQSLFSSHAMPFGTFGTHAARSQCEPESHSESAVHAVAHTGGV